MFTSETLAKLINESDRISTLVTKNGFGNLRLFKSKNEIYSDKLHFLVTVVNPESSLFDIAELKIELAQFLNLEPEDLIILTDGSLEHPSDTIEKEFAITKENINEIKASLLEYKAEPEYQQTLLQILKNFELNDLDKIVCLQEEITTTEDLIDLKNWINTANKDKLYPTSIAAYKAQLSLLSYFLAVIKDEKEIYKNLFLNAIQVAAICGKTEVLEFLYDLNPEFDLHTPIYNGNYSIHAASYHGQLATVQFLLDRHPNAINVLTLCKDRVIDLAAKSGDLNLVKFLIEKYTISLKICNDEGIYLIHFATASGNLNLIQWLLSQGADPEAETQDSMKQKPIHIAAEHGLIDILNELKKHVDNIHLPNGFGLTPLHLAVREGQKAMVEWLLQNGGDIDEKTHDKHANTLFHIAAMYGCCDLLETLLTHAETSKIGLNISNAHGYFPLHFVTANIAEIEVEYYVSLLGRQIKNEKSKKYQTIYILLERILHDIPFPFYLVARFFENVKSIATRIYLSDFFETKFEWQKVDYNRSKVIEWMLDHQVDIHQTTNDDCAYTPCHFAAAFGQLDSLKLLHNKGADINKAGKNGYAPIHLAAKYDQQPIIAWLLQQGVAISLATSQEKQFDNPSHTPITMAITNKSTKTLEFYVQNEAQINEEIKKTKPNWKGIFNETTMDDWTPVHYISLITIEDHPELIDLTAIETLLKSKIDVNAVTLRGETIFYLLMQKFITTTYTKKLDNYMRMISILLDHGLDVHIKTAYFMLEENIKEAGYSHLLRNLIKDIQYQEIATSLLHVFKEHGVHIDASVYVDYYAANFRSSSAKIEFLNFILLHFPEIYSQILEKCSKSLFNFQVGKPLLPPPPTQSITFGKKLIDYGFLVGRKLSPDEFYNLDTIFKTALKPTPYLAIGVTSPDNWLPGKAIIHSLALEANQITVTERLLFLRILSGLLINPMSSLLKEDIYEVKEVFCYLARATPTIDTLGISCQLLDKMLPNPSEKLSDNDIYDLKKLYIEMYKKITKEIPSLQRLCADALIRLPSFYLDDSKLNFNNRLLFFANSSERIRENREIILNKIQPLEPVTTDEQNKMKL